MHLNSDIFPPQLMLVRVNYLLYASSNVNTCHFVYSPQFMLIRVNDLLFEQWSFDEQRRESAHLKQALEYKHAHTYTYTDKAN